MRKKIFLFALVLMAPFLVSAKNFDEMTLKWTNDTESYYFDELESHQLSDGVLVVYVDKIEKYNYKTGYVDSYNLGESNIFASYLWGENLVVAYTDDAEGPMKFLLLDKDLKVIKRSYYDGDYIEYWDVLEAYDITEKDGKLYFSNYYGDAWYYNFWLDEDLNVEDAFYASDGSYIYFDSSTKKLTKYDKKDNAKGTYTFTSVGDDTDYVYFNKAWIFIDYDNSVGYIFDEELNLKKKLNNFDYDWYLYNDMIYLEDYDGLLYYFSDDYEITKCSKQDTFYQYFYVWDVLYDKYGENLYDYVEEIDNEGNHWIYVALNNGQYYQWDVELLYFDKNMNLVFTKEVENIDWSYYYWPCINISDDYLAIAYLNKELGRVNVIFYDKEGNEVHTIVVDDYDNTALPCIFNMTNNGINVALFPKSYAMDTKGKTDTKGELKILYYEMPYDIKVVKKTGGNVTITKKKAYTGEVIEVTATPDKGYVLSKVVVNDTSGNTLVYTEGKFTMPSSDVTVEAQFVPENPNTASFISIAVIVIGAISCLGFAISKKKLSWHNK